MRTANAAVLALATCLLIAADDPKTNAEKDRGNLQGNWTFVKAEENGVEGSLSDEQIKKYSMVIKGDSVVYQDRNQTTKSFVVDSTKTPKEIVFTRLQGQEKHIRKMTYSIEGDSLKLKFAGTGQRAGITTVMEYRRDAPKP